jgi:hypothetical protein
MLSSARWANDACVSYIGRQIDRVLGEQDLLSLTDDTIIDKTLPKTS